MGISDEPLFTFVLYAMYISGVINFMALPFNVTGYGKHAKPGPAAGSTMSPALAWFVMESPTLFLTLALYPLGRHRSHPISLLAVSLYLFHYLHRTLVYPLRLNGLRSAQPFPVAVAAAAFVFNLLNAYLQTRSLSHYAEYGAAYGSAAVMRVRVLVGVAVFVWGMRVNRRSDRTLLKLKSEGGGYKVPKGDWFEYVCSPNYMGEAAEWLGWAVMVGTPAAYAFFFYTCSNLVPRARSNLKWYREKFGEEFPKSRKAIVPFLY